MKASTTANLMLRTKSILTSRPRDIRSLAYLAAWVALAGCTSAGSTSRPDDDGGQSGSSLDSRGAAGQTGTTGSAGGRQPAVDGGAGGEPAADDAGQRDTQDADGSMAPDRGAADSMAPETPARPGDGSLGDANIKYVGRWDFSDPSQFVSYWGGAYLKVAFTGTTLKINLGTSTNCYVAIDGGAWTKFSNVNGTVNLTPVALAPGTHAATISAGKDYAYEFAFKGLSLGAGATTLASLQPHLVEFIGDSITSGYTDTMADVSDYAWLAATSVAAEHLQIAYPGIALVDGYGLNNDKTGMEKSYFKLKPLGYATNADWPATAYTPALVVINLGTNDSGTRVPASMFQASYVSFLAALRSRFPDAEVVVLRCFNGSMAAPTQMAVSTRVNAGDNNVHYLDTTGWLSASDYNDGVHPSDKGQVKIAGLLTPILASYLPQNH
jgi:lysophospholipase L1-like esterase